MLFRSVDFPDSVKALQKNWIGRKTWYDINYKVENSDTVITVSTTRPDTQFGSTFVVIAPDSEILEGLMSDIPKENIQEVKRYVSECKESSEEERQSSDSEKSGVFTGLYCVNSITSQRLPIWVANFVLTSVGTGAVVGVPAHDKRDFEFASRYGIPVVRVIEGSNGDRSDISKAEEVYEDEGRVLALAF